MNILILKPSSLGDIIHGLQVAQSIKEQISCNIDWVVRDRFAPIVSRCQTVDNILLFKRGTGIKSFIQLIKEIRKKHYDFCLDFQGLARTGLMTFLSRATNKIGRRDAREFANLAYHSSPPLPPSGKMSHAADILLQFLPTLGLKPELLGKLSFSLTPLTSIDARLTSNLPSPIIIIPNSRQPKKEWPYFSELTTQILTQFPAQPIIWDSHLYSPSPPCLEHNPFFINTTGKTGIEEMISLIASAKLVIANDSGPMHLSAAMEKPTLGIFGPTPPQRFAPYPPNRNTNHLIQAPNGDLTALSAESVFQIVHEILTTKNPS